MSLANLKLVTIICEPVLNSAIVAMARQLGASGVTITEVQGEGSAQKNSGEVPNLKIKIEIIVSADLAEKLMKRVAEDYFRDYSVITYSTEISVIRAEKF